MNAGIIPFSKVLSVITSNYKEEKYQITNHIRKVLLCLNTDEMYVDINVKKYHQVPQVPNPKVYQPGT